MEKGKKIKFAHHQTLKGHSVSVTTQFDELLMIQNLTMTKPVLKTQYYIGIEDTDSDQPDNYQDIPTKMDIFSGKVNKKSFLNLNSSMQLCQIYK